MKKVLYTKFNSYRRTDFQIKTSIIDEDSVRYVIKEAMNDKAVTQIAKMKDNYELLSKAYKDIKVIPYEETDNGLKFEFKDGTSLLEGVDFVHDDIDDIVTRINKALDIVLDISDEYIGDFEMSEEFGAFFSECIPDKEKSYKIANIDSIFDNFVVADREVWCLDYEWVLDFSVPVKYLIYRSILYLYKDNVNALEKRISVDDFMAKFGFISDNISVYQNMEACFQRYVHGDNSKYRYVNNYSKKSTSLNVLTEEIALKDQHINNLDANIANLNNAVELKEQHIKNLDKNISDLNEDLELKEQHISNLDENINGLKNDIDSLNNDVELKDQHIRNLEAIIDGQAAYINKFRRAIRNPFYAVGLATRKVCRKVMYRFASDELKEKQRIGKYKYKYKELMEKNESDYQRWIEELEAQEKYDETFSYNPKISVVIPVYNVLDVHLIPCIESVINQIYDNWELCLADDNSSWKNVKETLKKYEDNEKIKIVYRQENGHISRATNSAIEVATGEFIAFMDCDDLIRPNALYEVVKKLNENKDLDFIYSDEDKIDDNGKDRYMPHFKPDWSPDTFMSHMYTSHLGVYRKTIVDEIGGLRPGFEGAQDYDFTLRFTEKTDRIAHIPKILYHWRVRKESTAGSVEAKPYILEATVKAKEEALKRRGLKAKLELIDVIFQYRVNYEVEDNPLVSIIIPSKDNYDILERCITSLDSITEYKNYEIILVDNGSNDENKALYEELSEQYNIKYIYEKMDFNFSRMCNIGAENAKGTYYLFLNDDIEIIESEWLIRMLGQAEQKHTGAVGAKLLYPDNHNIQHTGVVNLKNGPAHAFSGYTDDYIYYCGRNRMDYDYIAVTAACLLMSAEKYQEIKGFNEDLAVAYNDVDLCFKLIEHGYYNVVRNDAVLLHHESISRGNDLADGAKIQRLMKEQRKLYQMHPEFDDDPFYNINLTQNKIDFSYNFEKERESYSSISEKKISGKLSDKVAGNIDILRVVHTVYIEGWAFIKGYRKNNDIDVKVIFYNDEHSFVVSTNRVYRPDVAETNKDELDVDFTGFRCEFPREDLPSGKYNVDILCRKERLTTDKTVEL